MIDFQARLDFTVKESTVIACSQNVNSCQYLISTLKGFGLWADDFITSSINLIKRSIAECSKDSLKFRYSPPELARELIKGPVDIL